VPRIFVALPLPIEAARALAGAVPDAAGLRRVAPELLHFTLAFVGQVAEERMAEVAAATDAAARGVRAFDVPIDALGRFPATGPIRVIWAGTGPAAPLIGQLSGRVRAELERRAVPIDAKPVRAHITLARVREGLDAEEMSAIAMAMVAARVPDGLRFRADAVHVMESQLSPAGARYSSRARILLRLTRDPAG